MAHAGKRLMPRRSKILALVLSVAGLVWVGCAPSPQSEASAQVTLMQAHLVETQAAIQATGLSNATQTAIAQSLSATQTAQALSFDATRTVGTRTARETATVAARTETAHQSLVGMTRTAEPFNAALVASRTQNESNRDRELTLGIGGIGICVMLILLAVWRWLNSRSNLIPRPAGVLEGVRIGDTVIDPSKALAPVTVSRPNGFVQMTWALLAVWYLLKYHRMPEVTEPQWTVNRNDSQATPDHLLSAHEAAQLPAAVAAMFQPWKKGNAQDREDRLRLGRQTARSSFTSPTPMALTPSVQPRIVDVTEQPERVREIAAALGHEPPGIPAGSPIDGMGQTSDMPLGPIEFVPDQREGIEAV